MTLAFIEGWWISVWLHLFRDGPFKAYQYASLIERVKSTFMSSRYALRGIGSKPTIAPVTFVLPRDAHDSADVLTKKNTIIAVAFPPWRSTRSAPVKLDCQNGSEICFENYLFETTGIWDVSWCQLGCHLQCAIPKTGKRLLAKSPC